MLSPKEGLDLEVDAYGGYEGRGEGIIAVANQKGCLADSRIADYQDLVHVVEVRVYGRVQALCVVLVRHFPASKVMQSCTQQLCLWSVTNCVSAGAALLPRVELELYRGTGTGPLGYVPSPAEVRYLI